MINVFIIGARGYTKKYGGWETLVHGLIDNQINKDIKYHIFEVIDKKQDETTFELDGIECIRIFTKAKGGFQMIFADIKAFKCVKKIVDCGKIDNPIILYLGARIGPIQWIMRHSLRKRNITVLENPAGLEWKRPKWGLIGSFYQYVSCLFTAIASDYIVCDCEAMKDVYNKMLHNSKKHPRLFVAYGAYPEAKLQEKKPDAVKEFYEKFSIKENNYYLIINRFMPENSWELILKQYLISDTSKDFIIISNIDKEFKYYNKLKKKLRFDKDNRIKFVGTTYDKSILAYIRHDAFAYFNGHTVGGTNPGLLEAMSTTGFVIARDCVFAREVCDDCALYFDDSNEKSLSSVISFAESLNTVDVDRFKQKAKTRMRLLYSWQDIARKYENIFSEVIKK